MSTARALGVIYLVMASVFGVAIALHQHPDVQRTAVATGRGTLQLTTTYVLRPGAAVAVAAGRNALHFTANYIVRPGAAAAVAGMHYTDLHLVRPAAAAGLRQLKVFFDAIDPPIRIARVEPRPRAVARKEMQPAPIALTPETPDVVATLEPIPPPTLPAQRVAAPEAAMTLPPPLRPAVNDNTQKFGASEPPKLALLQPQPQVTVPRNERLVAPWAPPATEPQRAEPTIDLTPGLIMSAPMPAGASTDIAPPGFISFCSRFMDQCVNSANNAPRVHLDLAAQMLLKAVTRSVNRAIWPETDERHYGRGEYWDIPTDGYGNCKDYALTKRKKLIEAGLPERALRLAIVVTPRENRHVVLTVSTDHGDLVLDNLNDDVKPWTEVAYQWIERQDDSGGLGWETFPQGVALTEIARRQAAAAALVALASPAPSRPAASAPLPRLALVQPLPQPSVAVPAPPPSGSGPLSPSELARVVERLRQNLTREMLANFELFLYVSKAEHGPWAQHMYVFAKADNGDLDLKYNWLVSTGREQAELNTAGIRLQTHTPEGYYQLDPARLFRHYTSAEWGQRMPFAMFFNWVRDGRQTGLAIHAATGGDVAMLGTRGSAGCIRLSPANAGTLFALIQSQYRGLAPRFAFDRRTGTMSNQGILLHDANGHVQLAQGYKVLIFIENYGGNDNVVAALF
jgi:predicted transglutaminase-like cysteine proteinase